MTDNVDAIIDSLTTHHDRLAALVEVVDDDGLVGPSGAEEWRVCDVLSHLGSGAEIMLVPLLAAIAGTPVPETDNQAVWDRWDAASPREQATWFLERDAELVGTLRGLTADQRESLRIDLGFLPEPVPLTVAGGMRLNEVAHHSWDVLAGLDASAPLDADAAEILLDLLAGPLSFMIGFTGKPEQLAAPAVVDLVGRGLSIGDGVELVAEAPVAATATFAGPAEAAARLLTGRLKPQHTPADVTVTGNVTLDDLRRVFPGF